MMRIAQILFVCLASTTSAATLDITIPATASVYGSNEDGVSGSTGPVIVDLTRTQLSELSILSVGLIDCCGGQDAQPTRTPDGTDTVSPPQVGPIFVNSFNGISGLQASNRFLYMMGAFVSSAGGTGAVPATLSYQTRRDYELPSYSPLLDQAFYIGDGRTGTGTGQLQSFDIPDGADQLLLGFADAPGGAGNPGAFSDNPGFVKTTIDLGDLPPEAQIPLPSSVWFLFAGLGAFAYFGGNRRKRSSA